MVENSYTNIKVEALDNAEIRITGEIIEKAVEHYRPIVMRSLKKDFEAPGFRKGNVPEKLIVERLGEPSILSEVAELALQDIYPKILTEEKLSVIGRPLVTLTKCAPPNPIGFSIQTAVLPAFELPDYKKIAGEMLKETAVITVTDTEVENVIEQIQRGANTEKEGSLDNASIPKKQELTDDFVRSLGDFKDVPDFKQKLSQNIRSEKERKERESKRMLIGEKIIEETKLAIPRVLIDNELEKIFSQFKGDIERMGTTFNDYLSKIEKTEEDIRAGLKGDAEKRARLQLILNKIATKEKIIPDQKAVEHELEHLREHIKDVDEDRARIYVETMLTNEEVFRFLESQDQKQNKSDAVKNDK